MSDTIGLQILTAHVNETSRFISISRKRDSKILYKKRMVRTTPPYGYGTGQIIQGYGEMKSTAKNLVRGNRMMLKSRNRPYYEGSFKDVFEYLHMCQLTS